MHTAWLAFFRGRRVTAEETEKELNAMNGRLALGRRVGALLPPPPFPP